MTELPEFDVLVEMARNNPQGLERLRDQLNRQVIDAQNDEMKRQRLKGLVFRIDMERKRAQTPMAATIKLSEMMCWKLAELNRCFLEPEESDVEHVSTMDATVIPFRTPDA